MRQNFTQSGAETHTAKHSQTDTQLKDGKMLLFVQKIVDVMSLFFKTKSTKKTSNIIQESNFDGYSSFSIGGNNLQEYFTDKNNNQLSNTVPDFITNQDSIMNKFSIQSNSSVKEYRLGSHFDKSLEKWIPSFSSPRRIYNAEGNDNRHSENSSFRGFATTILLVLFTVLGLSAQTIKSVDLSLHKSINNSLPALNGTVKYVMWLKNSGPSTASTIVVQDNFPIAGATLTSHNGGANFSYDASTGIGLWSVPSVASGDSVGLEIIANVTQRGVFFNTAEVKSMGANQEDIDSTPNNSKLYEDDIAASCFSVPLLWYPGEEYTVSVPAPYKYGSTIKWYRNNTAEMTTTTTQAVVNSDSSLTIKTPGNYTFTTNVTNCPAQGCCAVQVIEGPYGSIGDYVWQDTNNDGKQGTTTAEPPIKGVRVYLLNASGIKLDSTETDAMGKYLFDSLTTDTYRIQFVKPATYDSFTLANAGNDTKDSDVDASGLSPLISIDTSLLPDDILRNNLTIDAGIKPNYGSIGDYVWADVNNDGQQAGEAPIEGVKVYLLDAAGMKLDSTTTNSIGKYLFDSLTSGTYRVQFVAPAGSIASKPNFGGGDLTDSDPNKIGLSQLITINTTLLTTDTLRNNPNIDAGFVPVGSLGDYVFADNNGDGIQNSGDSPVVGLKVYLLNASGIKIDSTTTTALGKYEFDSLLSGSYKVKFVLPVGSETTGKLLGGNTATDSNVNSDGITDTITIDATQALGSIARNNNTIDAGIKTSYGSIGDYVWEDKNNDGIQNDGNTGIKGIIIELYASDASGNPIGTRLSVDTTDINGFYLFDNLLKGDFVVKIVSSTLPSGSAISTKKDLGADDTKDSDFSTVGLSQKISLDPSNTGGDPLKKNNPTIDAGIYFAPLGSIGDYVWRDLNNNGLQDDGNTGISGIIVELYASDAIGLPVGSALKKDTTDANGKYLFTGLQAGNYVVKIVIGTLPAGSQLTTKQDVGMSDAVDSDFNSSTGLSDKIVIDPSDTARKDVLTVDGGIFSPLGSIGDFVWNDLNNNGLQDTGEPGVENVRMELYASDNLGNPIGAALNTTLTNASGYYSFGNLTKGDYVVKIVTTSLPTTYALSTKVDLGGDDTKDTDFNATTGLSPKISIDPLVLSRKDIITIDGAVYVPVICSELTAITTNGDICASDTTTIKGTISGGGKVKWYLTPIGGTVIFTTNSGESYKIFPTTTTVYYAEIENAPKNCANPRQPVVIVVNIRPSNPSCEGVVEGCIGKTINLKDHIINGATTPGGKFEWHTTANPNSPLVANTTAVGAGTYYLFEKSGAGCFSNPTVLKVVLKNCEKLINLSLTKTVDNITPAIGDNLTYTIKVSNAGPDAATNVEVTDVLPSGLQFVASPFFANNSGVLTLIAPISNIAAGQTIILTYSVKITAASPQTNFAQVTKADQKDEDSTPGNGTTTKEDDDDKIIVTPKTPQEPIADLSLDKTVSNSAPNTGDIITYYIDVKNDGTSNATNVEVSDIVPAGLQVQLATGGDVMTIVGNSVVAKFNQINIGQTVSFKIVAKVTATIGTIKNFAQVSKSDQKDPDSTPNNGVDKNEDDDDDAEITIKQSACNTITPLIACSNPYICLGESVSIEAIGCNGTIVWSNGQVGSLVTVTPSVTTTYTAQCKINDNCISPKSNPVTVVVNVIAAPLVTSNSTTNTICVGGKIKLTANNCTGTVTWSNGATGASIEVSAAGTYTATCKKGECTSGKSNVITVTVGVGQVPNGPGTISINKPSVCGDEKATLIVGGCNGVVVWSTGQSGTTISVGAGTYTFKCVNSCGESSISSSITITNGGAGIAPVITASKDNLCGSEPVTLTATCTGTILWSTGATTAAITVTPAATTTYEATCTVNGCSGKATKTITVGGTKPAPPIVTCGKERICAGESLTFVANGCAGSVMWSTGATGATMIVTPTVTTTYTATCTSNGCTSNPSKDAVITVLNQTPPTITATADAVCSGASVKLTASLCAGTVSWNTGATTAVITVTPTVATTYTVKCIVDECESSASKTITIGTGQVPNAPALFLSKTVICNNEKATLTAICSSGTVKWSTGETTSAISVSAGTYSAVCVSSCGESLKSNNFVVIDGGTSTPPVITTTATALCGTDKATLTANGCIGTVKWSTGATGSTISVGAGVYSAICSNICGESGNSNVITITNGGSGTTPTITASKDNLCGSELVTLTATGCTGTLTWSTGATTATITVTPTATTTYEATCTTNSCVGKASKTITVGGNKPPTPIVTCGKERICAGESLTFVANGCAGTVTWSTGATGATMIVTPTVTTTYTAICTVNGCASDPSKPATITVLNQTPPTITASSEGACGGASVTLTASNCAGTILWNIGATTATITVTPTAATTYTVKCIVDECESSASKTVNVGTGTAPNAPVIVIGETLVADCSSKTRLDATGCTGTVKWSTGATGNSITVEGGSYTATCSNACGESAKSNTLNIPVVTGVAPLTITASTEGVCSGESTTLTASICTGKILWSTGATTSTITVTPTVETTYTAKCTVGICERTASKTIKIGNGQAPVAPVIVSNKSAVCGNETATLTASGCVGAVKWSTGAAGLTISVGAGTYSAKCGNTCGTSENSNVITIKTGSGATPTITASTTALCEAGNVTLTAAGCSGAVIWSNTQTGAAITVNVATTTTFSATCQGGECGNSKSNEITVTVGKPDKPAISSNKTAVCSGDAVVLTATGCAGTTVWSNGMTGASITVNPTTNTEYTAVCKLPQGGCTSDQSNKVIISVITKAESPVISCSATRICKGDTLTLNALGCAGTVLWSTGQTAASINIMPDVTTIYTAICKVGSCESAPSAAATINVGSPIPPVISCKNTQICSGSSTQIEAAGCTGTVKWSDGQMGAVITVSPTAITSYSAICDGGRCQSEKSNVITVQVTGSGLTKPTVKDLVNLCPYTTVDLTTGVTSPVSSQGGGFVFRTGTTSGSPAVTNPATAGTGTYYVFEKAGNGCYSEAGKINVNITSCEPVNPSCATNPATAKAGKDSTVCLSDDFFTLKGQIGGSASSAKWTTDGKGSFENALSLTTKYNYSKEDVIKGNVTFTLTTNDPDDNGSCVAATSSYKITLNGVTTVPTIASDKSPNICFGDSVVLTANEAGKYKWSNGATTKSITVKTPGRYTVKLINDGGCTSLSSNEIIVVLGSAISAPTVAAITKNTCPATVVNLNSAVTSQPKSQGGVFEFHTGSAANSPILANVSAVGAGTYYVIEKSTIGCYGQSAPIIVMIDQCTPANPADTLKTELSIEIIGSRVELKVGDPVTYTITVKNNSTKTATNVNVVNVLPKGITITSTTPGFTAFGTDSLLSVIGSLPGGATKTYTYEAKTTKAGKIINTAKITKLDQIDPITSNNISQWSVECKTCQETCVGLAFSADTTRQANGSYNITFRALIEACGNVKLEGVKITENLATMFPAPTTFTIIQKPTAGVGSKLLTNDSFNGTTDLNLTIPAGSIVEVGKVDTVKFVINIVPNGKEGPFTTNAFAEAVGNTAFGIPQDVSDVSNNGKTVDKPSAEPTVVKLYKSASIGLAKMISDSTKKADGSYDITYQLLIKNNGSLALNDVIVRDTLSKVFKAPATFTVVGVPTKNAGSQFAINSAFNGSSDSRLTLAGSTLAIGKTDTLKFKVNIKADTIKSFANTAVASAAGTLTSGSADNVTDLSNAGNNPDAPGASPTNLSLGNEGGSSIEVPCVGIALYVKDTLKQPDGSYNITYNAIIKNCGNLNLSNVQVCDTLAKTFNLPAVATIVQKPTVSAGSQLKTDNTYDGIANTCMLLSDSKIAPNKIDTIKWVINVQLNGNKGPFRNTVIVTAKTPSSQTITDASNAGIDPNPVGSTPTVTNFNSLPDALIGIAKSASEAVKVAGTTNTYDVTFTFKVKNYGKVAFTGVQVQDNLSVTFGDSVKIDSVNLKVDTGFTANSKFTGRGSLINLLVDSSSTLPVNTTRNITLFTRVTLTAGKNKFTNQALAIGRYPSNKSVDDLSTTGTDPDPDANGTPKDNSLPTSVQLGTNIVTPPTPTFSTTLGIAKAATLDPVKNADGTYNVKYSVILKNYSIRKLTNVQLSDSLGKVFADSAEFVLVGKPTLNKNSKLKIDSTFNGRTVVTMLKADSSSLAVGASDTLTFNLRLLSSKKSDAIYANTINGIAKDSTTNVKDISQAGLNPDPDGDKNPGNNNEPTVITIKGKTSIADSLVIIPGGFSPNGDGSGDKFVITGVNKTDRIAEIYIYNRWGQLIYQSTDFGKEEGWDGIATNGLLIGSKGVGVPDGTYYYCVKAEGLWEDKARVGFITIAR